MNTSPWARAKISFRIRKGFANPQRKRDRYNDKLDGYTTMLIPALIRSSTVAWAPTLSLSLTVVMLSIRNQRVTTSWFFFCVNRKGSVSDG
jgi:hypothetical protein